ncbi:hypothetical protein VNO77_07451 [Canavalia gladiata]|uniref:BHLH domain-containing protein n=1 Tax=Canavalia gladiata TaxID=3824 RepID=A0AAN9M8L7_CANGL
MDYYNPEASNQASSAGSSSKANKNKENKKNSVKKSKGVRLSTDPQSVAARERRHRISDRFKILQSMVPGGSKMDTVSMLEEAIQYVKFLKTQIWLHQTMINFMDDNESLSPNMYLSDYYVPSQQIISPNQNPILYHYSDLESLVNLPNLPLPQCSFQGEDTTCFDANLKYWGQLN